MFSSLYTFLHKRTRSERPLLLQLQSGDPVAFKTFYDRHIRSAHYMAYGFMNQKLGAEDLGFETLKEIWRNRETLDTSMPAKVIIAETMVKVYLRNIQAMNN